MNKTIVILSGGMDSVTLLHKVVDEAKKEIGEGYRNFVGAISFDYGQIHRKELVCARWQCDQLGIGHRVVDIQSLNHILPSALTSKTKEVPKGHYENESMKQTVVPFRNSIMSTIALGYAAGLGFNRIALGVHQGDHAIYPDCRAEYVEKALRPIAALGDYNPIEVYTPFLDLTKIEILKEGFELGVDYSHTWTSYSAGDLPDYTTGSSVERTQAFIANGKIDPLYTPELWEKAKEYAELAQRAFESGLSDPKDLIAVPD